MSFHTQISVFTFAVGFTVFSSSQAVAVEPATFDVGVFKAAPTVTVDQKYDDNIFSQDNDEVDSWVTVLSPSIQAQADNGTHSYTLGYQMIAGYYSNSTDDNYLDHRITAEAEWELNHRNTLGANFEFYDTHEERGTGFSQGDTALLLSSPDDFRETVLGGEYIFGGIKSKGRLVSELEYYDKRYTNHRTTTRTRDREHIELKETFYWGVSGNTDILVQGAYADINYKNDPASVTGVQDTLDSKRVQVLTGVNWKATGKTEGEIKLGYEGKSFDDSDRDDFNGLSWDAKVKWSPKEYSVLSASTGRSQEEANGSGDFIDTETVSFDWRHDWNERFNTLVNLNFIQEDYEGDVNGQEDDTYNYTLRVNYEMRRWLSLGSSFRYEERSSNQQDQDYKRNIVALHIEASL